jgi:hypothetical protein
MSAHHVLKCWRDPFQAVWDGRKLYEIRKDDRHYMAGDRITLRECEPVVSDLGSFVHYLSREIDATIRYITPGGNFGLPADMCVMSLRVDAKRGDGIVVHMLPSRLATKNDWTRAGTESAHEAAISKEDEQDRTIRDLSISLQIARTYLAKLSDSTESVAEYARQFIFSLTESDKRHQDHFRNQLALWADRAGALAWAIQQAEEVTFNPPDAPNEQRCEHSDEHLTEVGQRFCSEACQRCESGEEDCPECKEDAAIVDVEAVNTPIDMMLFCPSCGTQHVDAPEESTGWTNPPHRSHKCHQCGTIWRPADVTTNGVAETKTKGKADTSQAIYGRYVLGRYLDIRENALCVLAYFYGALEAENLTLLNRLKAYADGHISDPVSRAEVLHIIRNQPNARGTMNGERQRWVKNQIERKVSEL